MKKLILLLCCCPVIIFPQNWNVLKSGDYCDTDHTFRQIKFNPFDSSMWIYDDSEFLTLYPNGESEFGYWDDFPCDADIKFVYGIEFIENVLYGLDRWEGLFKLEDGTIEVIESTPNRGLYISKGENDTLYLCTDDGYNKGYFIYKEGYLADTSVINSDLHFNGVGQVLKDNVGRLWLTHWVWYDQEGGGASVYDGEWNWYFVHNSNLPNSNVTKFVQKADGTIIGMTLGGMVVFNEEDEDWDVYDMSNTNMPGENLSNGLIDSEGRIWALFDEVGIGYTTNYTDWTIFDAENSPFDGEYIQWNILEVDHQDNIWFFDYPGIYVLSLDEFEGWLSIQNNEIETANIYPNPTENYLTIESKNRFESVEILDLYGKSVYQKRVEGETFTFDISNLKNGVYIVNLQTSLGKESYKVLKK